MGFEPTTASLEGWNSTTELRPPNQDFAAVSFFVSLHRHNRSIRYLPYSIAKLSIKTAEQALLVGRQGFEPWKP